MPRPEDYPTDPAFIAALKARSASDDWKLRAIAGYTMRLHSVDPEAREQANRHGLSRALTPDERAAWTFGFTWLDQGN